MKLIIIKCLRYPRFSHCSLQNISKLDGQFGWWHLLTLTTQITKMSEVNERSHLLGSSSAAADSIACNVSYTTISLTDSGAAELGVRVTKRSRKQAKQDAQRSEGTDSNQHQQLQEQQGEGRCGRCCSGWWLCSLEHKERMVLLGLLMMDFCTNSCLSIMAPIFPQEVGYNDLGLKWRSKSRQLHQLHDVYFAGSTERNQWFTVWTRVCRVSVDSMSVQPGVWPPGERDATFFNVQ